MPDSKLPVSAIWKCSTGSNVSFSFGNNKYQGDKAKNYFACDITSINYERLTATADVFYQGEDDATEVSDIYLHELSLVNMNSEDEVEDGDMDIDTLTEEEIKSANVMLDHLRFFCTVVWFPWDEKQEDEIDDSFCTNDPKEDWVEIHLEHRIDAFSDYLKGNNDVYDRLIKLAGEHDQLMNRQNSITSFYEHDDLGKDELIIGENLEIEDALDNIKKQADRLENPTLRSAVEKMARLRKVEKRQSMMSNYARVGHPSNNQVICLVTGKLTNLKEMTEFMQKAPQKVGIDIRLANVTCRETLQSAVDDLLPGDIIVLPPGDHVLKDWGDLKEGGSLYGIDPNDPSLVELSTMSKRYGIEVRNGANFENIVFSSSHLTNNNDLNNDMSFDESESIDISSQLAKRHGLLVKSGSVKMVNCTFLGLECAAKVMENGSLAMEKCKLNLNKVGLIAEKHANITLNDVSFEGDIESDVEKYGIIIMENMAGNNIAFNKVNLRFDSGHFIFVDPGFFAKKQNKESFLYYENSWQDVSPLLSKSLKNNLLLEHPVSYHLHHTPAKKSFPLKVVAMLLMDNYDYAKSVINIKPPIPDSSLETPSEDGAGDCGMITRNLKENDLFITSSGTMITSTMA